MPLDSIGNIQNILAKNLIKCFFRKDFEYACDRHEDAHGPANYFFGK